MKTKSPLAAAAEIHPARAFAPSWTTTAKTKSLLAAASLLLFAALPAGAQNAPAAADDSGVRLTWSEGQAPFSVYCGPALGSLIDASHLLGQTSSRVLSAPLAGGSIWYCAVIGTPVNDPPERCDGIDNDDDGTADEPGAEAYCSLPRANAACVLGECRVASCWPGFADCNGLPNDGCESLLSTDPLNCGACGVVCGAGKGCLYGSCVDVCPGAATRCDGVCRDVTSDTANCGACGRTCTSGQVCSNGDCAATCQSGLNNCAGACRNLQNDPANCGACGATCAAGQYCAGGNCYAGCQPGLTNCSGNCRDLQNDEDNCGTCGRACASGEVCSGGACVVSCASGLTNCGGVCRDLTADRTHCGSCATVCGAGSVCTSSTCATTCSAGRTICSGVCRDLTTDDRNCGACGRACGAGTVCKNSLCVAG